MFPRFPKAPVDVVAGVLQRLATAEGAVDQARLAYVVAPHVQHGVPGIVGDQVDLPDPQMPARWRAHGGLGHGHGCGR